MYEYGVVTWHRLVYIMHYNRFNCYYLLSSVWNCTAHNMLSKYLLTVYHLIAIIYFGITCKFRWHQMDQITKTKKSIGIHTFGFVQTILCIHIWKCITHLFPYNSFRKQNFKLFFFFGKKFISLIYNGMSNFFQCHQLCVLKKQNKTIKSNVDSSFNDKFWSSHRPKDLLFLIENTICLIRKFIQFARNFRPWWNLPTSVILSEKSKQT